MRFSSQVCLLVFAIFMTACAHRPRLVPTPMAQIKVYTIDKQMLLAPDEKLREDIPLEVCEKELCHVFVGDAYLSLKKYIIDLEEDLRNCQIER